MLQLFVVFLAAVIMVASQKVIPQNPVAFHDAFDRLRGRGLYNELEVRDMILNSRAGQDYPNLDHIPPTGFNCSTTHQPGYYADTHEDARCQVFHRCDINGNMTSYLCPNMTLFNQITLTCSWYFHIDCNRTEAFYDYSNSRLYQGADIPLLDDYWSKLFDYLNPETSKTSKEFGVPLTYG